MRHQRATKDMLDALGAAGLRKEARLVRRPLGREQHPQALLLSRRPA